MIVGVFGNSLTRGRWEHSAATFCLWNREEQEWRGVGWGKSTQYRSKGTILNAVASHGIQTFLGVLSLLLSIAFLYLELEGVRFCFLFPLSLPRLTYFLTPVSYSLDLIYSIQAFIFVNNLNLIQLIIFADTARWMFCILVKVWVFFYHFLSLPGFQNIHI